jgi:transcriptional regulator with XRE-family HTH domain
MRSVNESKRAVDDHSSVSDVGEFIRQQRERANLSLRRLADRAGISNPYLSQIERGIRRPSAEILKRISRALEISAETLYVRAGILDEPSGLVDPVSEIRRDPRITEDQKKTLIHIYESFLRENDLEIAAVADAIAEEAVTESEEDAGAEPASPVDGPSAGGHEAAGEDEPAA